MPELKDGSGTAIRVVGGELYIDGAPTENADSILDAIGRPRNFSERHPRENLKDLITLFPSGGLFTYFSGTGTVSADTSDYIFGSESMKVVTAGDAGQTNIRASAIGPYDFTNGSIRFWFKVSDFPTLGYITIYMSSDAFATFNTYEVAFGGGNEDTRLFKTNEWHAAQASVGTPTSQSGITDLSAITDMQIAIADTGGGSTTVHMNLLGNQPNRVEPAMTVWFDDARDGAFLRGRPVLDKYGFRGTVAIIQALLDTPSFMTLQQAKDLEYYNGWTMAGHHYSDLAEGFHTLTEAELRSEVQALQNWMADNGFFRGIHHIAYPYGGFNATTLRTINDYMATGRTISGVAQYETIPAADPYRLKAHSVISSDTVGALQAMIDDTIAGNAWLHLIFHQISSGAPSMGTEYSQADLDTVMAYAYNNGVRVMTVDESSGWGRHASSATPS